MAAENKQKDKEKTKERRGGRRRTTWVKGMPAPPGAGRPKLGMTWADLIKAVGDELISGKENEYKGLNNGISRREASVRKGYEFIAKGSHPILREFIEREDGKVAQPVDVTERHILEIYLPNALPEGAARNTMPIETKQITAESNGKNGNGQHG